MSDEKILPPEYGWIGNAAIWVFGCFWWSEPMKPDENLYGIRIREIRPALWELAPCGDYFSITIKVSSAPCFLHRWMQRICFGVKYRRVRVAKNE